MLKQMLQQNASKPEAKSNQSQRQIVAPRLPVLNHGETAHHFVALVDVHAPSSAPDVVAEPSDDMMPADLDWEVCTLCDAFGRPGRLALATAVCDTCGYDPYGYYDDQPFEVLR